MKYCPLCRSEYRDEVAACFECNLELVASLEAESVRNNPPKLLWIGKDAAEFERVAAALRDAGIPAHAVDGGTLGRIFKSNSTIHVLSSDFLQAIELAERAFESATRNFDQIQTCHACATMCSAALTVCPKCSAVLRVERESERDETNAASERAFRGQRKYCPMCDSEYSLAHQRCSVCGVELVPEEQRGQPRGEKEKKEPLEIVWRGGDPVALGRVIAALEEAGIRHHVQSSSDHLVFELAMPRPKYIIRVLSSDADHAIQLLASIQDNPFFGTDASIEPIPSGAGNRTKISMPKWNPASATVEIWSSDDAAMTRLIEDCLDENRLRFRRQGFEPGVVHLFVQPEMESRAREILRQIVEGTPQE